MQVNKPVLVHVPKTAGTSVHKLSWVRYAGHVTHGEAMKLHGVDSFYFSIVRHPVDRFISCMAAVYQAKNAFRTGQIKGLLQESFKGFIEGIAEMLHNMEYYDEIRENIYFRPQIGFTMGVQFIIYFEQLNEGLLMLSDKFRFRFVPSDLKHEGGIRLHKPDRLSDRAIYLIESFYHEDMIRFGYESKTMDGKIKMSEIPNNKDEIKKCKG